MKMSVLDRVLLLATGLLAAYQVAVGIDGFATLPVIAYTIAFGILLLAGLLLIILGFEVLEEPAVAILSTLIPLSLATGLVWEYLAAYRVAFLAFSVLGFIVVLITRVLPGKGILPTVLLAIVHGVAGLSITVLPVYLVVQQQVEAGFVLVGMGGALIGVGGLLLSFLKTGKPLLSKDTILKVLPGLLLLMTICYVIGFQYG
ncbi:MAG: hypothetical protein JW862_06180 [Anaerolineales bacterium]|nr:hypothetical protein [Anaerolineales bacterium]